MEEVPYYLGYEGWLLPCSAANRAIGPFSGSRESVHFTLQCFLLLRISGLSSLNFMRATGAICPWKPFLVWDFENLTWERDVLTATECKSCIFS